MTKIKLIDEQGNEVSPTQLLDALRSAAAAHIAPQDQDKKVSAPKADIKPEPTDDLEETNEQALRRQMEEEMAELYAHRGAEPKEEHDVEEKPDKATASKEKIDKFFKEAEAELPKVRKHVRNAGLAAFGVATAVGALAVVAAKRAIDHKK